MMRISYAQDDAAALTATALLAQAAGVAVPPPNPPTDAQAGAQVVAQTSAAAAESPADAPIPGARLAFSSPLEGHPAQADRKAMFVVAVAGLILTTLGFFAADLWDVGRSRGPAAGAPMLAAVAAISALVLLAGRWAYAAYVLPLPATPGEGGAEGSGAEGNGGEGRGGKGSLTFFQQIAGRSFDDYAAAVKGLTHRLALRDVLNHNYNVAVQAARKYALVGKALAAMRVAIPIWLLLLFLVAVCG